MTSSPTSKLPIICDWLDVTYAPDNCPYPELNLLLLGAGFLVTRDRGGSRCYVPPSGRGMLQVTHAKRFARISASGAACAALRALGLWGEYLWILSTSTHRVTRLDAALDLPADAADFLQVLQARYPSGWVNLGRKAQRVTEFLTTRADGRKSGTYYVGHKDDARQSVRVYDKSLEALEKRSEVIPTTTRIEATARKDKGATLRDAAVPAAIFWAIVSPAIISAPPGAPEWTPNMEQTWVSVPSTYTPAETLKRRIEDSAELDALLELADSIGPSGRRYMLHLLSQRTASRAPIEQDAA